jgi:FG-GAP-like repeat
MFKHHSLLKISALALLGMICTTMGALALINPAFTPNHLMNQAESVLIVKMGKPDAGMKIALTVVKVIKGKKPAANLIIDLSNAPQKAWAKRIAKLATLRKGAPVPFFTGKFKEEKEADGFGDEEGGEDEPEAQEIGLLQIDRDWIVLLRDKNNTWNMSHVDVVKQGTFDGGSDMLIKAISYLKKNPEDLVPISEGYGWDKSLSAGKVSGKVTGLVAVDVDGKGRYALHVSSEGGDRLFLCSKGKFADITAGRKLAVKSSASAWGDFNGDGKLDLASISAGKLVLSLQNAKGIFSSPRPITAKVEGKLLDLTVVDAGTGAKSGLLVSREGLPVLLKPSGKDFTAETLDAGETKPETLGAASYCIAGDFDGDNLCDLIQPFEKGSLAFKGLGGGKFAPAIQMDIGTGKGRSSSCVGDYDMDGVLDIYLVGPGSPQLWSNRGKFKFVNVFGHSGEMCYTAQSNGIGTGTCDFNNDGRQDLFIAYGNDSEPPAVHMYFSRGYRSFGKCLTMVWENKEDDFTADTSKGLQAATVADLNGDYAQDLVLVQPDGTVKVYLREIDEDEMPIAVRAVLPAGSTYAGPVTVTGWNNTRCLGSWVVTPGSTGGFFGLMDEGELKVSWQLPGGKKKTKTFALENDESSAILKLK